MKSLPDAADFMSAAIDLAFHGLDSFATSNQDSAAMGPSLLTQLFNDTGNAERFVALHRNSVRYCYVFKSWLIWDGRRWARDESERVRQLAKSTVVEFLRQAIDSKNEAAQRFARSSLETKRIDHLLREAQTDLAISPAELDQHQHLLVFMNRTVDLRNGELGPHEREHYITKMVRFDFNPNATCNGFLAALHRLMGGGPDASELQQNRAGRLVGALQKCFGYSLTGATIEKVVFILFGSGNNGKTTVLSLFLKLLEEYAALLQIETLMVRHENNNSQADLADLRGARFVMTSETEEGQRLAEGKLKRITQGMGRIKATRKYENPFEFAETHKLYASGFCRVHKKGPQSPTVCRPYPEHAPGCRPIRKGLHCLGLR